MTTTATDRIEKTIRLRAPRSRVWRAVTNAEQFGTWFGVKIDGEFAEGVTVRGKITHLTLEMVIERIEPERLFAYRWHPHAVDAKADYSAEPMTLVEFTLDETGDGTILTIVESGFDRLPLARRAEAFRMNEGGWSEQLRRIDRYVSQP